MACSSKNDEPLTEEQRNIVTKNHDLIYAFAHKKNISIDEYYDVLAIGLCKAAKSFDNDKGEFSTFAYTCMNNELNECWRSLNKKSSIPECLIISCDSETEREDVDNRKCFLDVFSDCQSCEYMSYVTMVHDILDRLTDKEKYIFVNMINETPRQDVANKMGCTVQNMTRYVQNIRNTVESYLSY